MTDRQYEIARGMLDYLDEHGYAPSVANIAGMLDRSTTTTFKNLTAMRELGMIDWIIGEPRTMHVTKQGQKQLATATRQARAARASRR